MRFLQSLRSLPFWPQIRPDYFTHGVEDGKEAAFHSPTALLADNTQIGEQAIFAAAALPGPVAPDDARIYKLGWIEGYHTKGARTALVTGQ